MLLYRSSDGDLLESLRGLDFQYVLYSVVDVWVKQDTKTQFILLVIVLMEVDLHQVR